MHRLINHAKYLLTKQAKSDDMFINLIQIFRQMIFHDYQAENKTVNFVSSHFIFLNKIFDILGIWAEDHVKLENKFNNLNFKNYL